MPLGFERINARTRQPNSLINFIKPLETKDKAIAQDILECVAAIVYPIMRDNYLAVMALEEFPPNKEFWGRNFNYGEVVQLVLKSPTTGQWLPIHMIEQVMLHELAHIKEMNHSRDFHKLRLSFVDQLSKLKSRGYTGEGFWAPGRIVHPSADFTNNRLLPKEELPEDLCGGTFKRQRKRRRPKENSTSVKPQLSAAERKERWLKKKFGSIEGNTIGADEESRIKLEGGKKVKGKPRVASSARGRDLRAEAALKRFAIQPREKEPEDVKKVLKNDDDEEFTTSDEEDEKAPMIKVEDQASDADALDAEFSALACGLVPLDVKKELSPSPCIIPLISKKITSSKSLVENAGVEHLDDKQSLLASKSLVASNVLHDDDTTDEGLFSNPKLPKQNELKPNRLNSKGNALHNLDEPTPKTTASDTRTIVRQITPKPSSTSVSRNTATSPLSVSAIMDCGVCSTSNPPAATICLICANVLKSEIPSWRCESAICREGEGKYRNSMDCRICGVCGERRIGVIRECG